MLYKRTLRIKYFFIIILTPIFSYGQVAPNRPVYNSLLWEITGNGLTKPSYLFGTMHVSSKMAFHLGDSFYFALKQADAVALELNPELWQPQMARLAELNNNYLDYIKQGGNQFLNEKSFQIKKFDDRLKFALSSEPPAINNLLYRSYKERKTLRKIPFWIYIFTRPAESWANCLQEWKIFLNRKKLYWKLMLIWPKKKIRKQLTPMKAL